MSHLGPALARVAPLYNLFFVIISIFLFIALFRQRKQKGFMLPWKLLFAVILIFVTETIFTILRTAGFLPQFVYYFNGAFEFSIGILIVFLLLKQKEYVKMHYS